jgi:hypothetical protein
MGAMGLGRWHRWTVAAGRYADYRPHRWPIAQMGLRSSPDGRWESAPRLPSGHCYWPAGFGEEASLMSWRAVGRGVPRWGSAGGAAPGAHEAAARLRPPWGRQLQRRGSGSGSGAGAGAYEVPRAWVRASRSPAHAMECQLQRRGSGSGSGARLAHTTCPAPGARPPLPGHAPARQRSRPR